MIIFDIAIQNRKCRRCEGVIKKGEHHIRSTTAISGRTATDNLCIDCIMDFLNDKNRPVKNYE